jgi:hypothetical protein
MSNFKGFKKAVNKQMEFMSEKGLFQVDIDKDSLWDLYLSSFPEGTNDIFRERTVHDCSCCRNFVKNIGHVVSIVDNKLVSIWDIEEDGVDEEYITVAKEMSKYVKSNEICDIFLYYQPNVGIDFNYEIVVDGPTHKWEHFFFKLPNNVVVKNDILSIQLAKSRDHYQVYFRGLKEITIESAETVLELIDQDTLYRGTEHKLAVSRFVEAKKKFDKIPQKDQINYCWDSLNKGEAYSIRNSVIGTLLVDISKGVELNTAVSKFESKVAPLNYKRPKALISKTMISNAKKVVKGLGIENSLSRRYAVTEDISVNNVLFADRSTKKVMKDAFDELSDELPDNLPNLDKVEEVSVETFLSDILPKVNSIEALLENSHQNNLMSVIAPIVPDAKDIFKWDNNFSWSYKGEVTDSLKEEVKKAGGNIDAVLRFSIQWNEKGENNDDLDAHCRDPSTHVYFSSKGPHNNTGHLDIDITNPGEKIAVENITYTDKSKMMKGDYLMSVKNFTNRGGKGGFRAQIEFDGKIYDYDYLEYLKGGREVQIATVHFDGVNFSLKDSMEHSSSTKEVWGVSTQKYHKVKMLMKSPNHWDGEETGNSHLFFILEDCNNPSESRGFYNEFLKENLKEHRKVFEVLGSKMKTEKSNSQLSGLGFSSTVRSHVVCKLSGSFSRVIKIKF